MSTTLPPPLAKLIEDKARADLSRLDLLRSVKAAAEASSQVEVAELLHVSQPYISKRIKQATLVEDPQPYEMCQRFAAHQLDRAELISVLSRWDYVDVPVTSDLADDLRFDTPGSFDEVEAAYRDKLIDADLYDDILNGHDEWLTSQGH